MSTLYGGAGRTRRNVPAGRAHPISARSDSLPARDSDPYDEFDDALPPLPYGEALRRWRAAVEQYRTRTFQPRPR